MFRAIWEFAQSRDCVAHSQNPEIAFQSRDCANSQIARNIYIKLSLRNTISMVRYDTKDAD